jgi:hypothetical protein
MSQVTVKIVLLVSAMLVIAGIIRLLKSDTALPWTVPPKWRPILAIVLGTMGAGICSIVKAAWPAFPLTWEQIIETGLAGPAFSSLLNGVTETVKAPPAPVLVKSVHPPPLPPEDPKPPA